MTRNSIGAIATAGGAPIPITTRAWYNPNLEPAAHDSSSDRQFDIDSTLLLTGLSVAREREQGTFEQLLLTPFRPVEIMAGKALSVLAFSACGTGAHCRDHAVGSLMDVSPSVIVTERDE